MQQTLFDSSATKRQNPSSIPFDQNQKKPGYKWVKFIGWIPDEWPVRSIGEVTTKVGSGKTPRGGEKAYVETGITFVRSQNVLKGQLDLCDVVFITNEQHAEMSSTRLQAQDVLLNITGASIGRSCVVPDDLEAGNVNQHVCIIRTKNEVNPKYLSDLLNGRVGQHQIYSFQTGGSREGLTFAQIRAFQIPVPPIDEQKRIAASLRTWDRVLAKIDALIDAKKTRLKGLRQRLLTGEERFPEFTEPWREVRLGGVTSEVDDRNDGTYAKDRVYGVTNKNGVTANTSRAPSSDLERYKIVPPDGFAYNPMRLDVGSIGRVMVDAPVLVSGDYVAFSCTRGKLSPRYMSHLQQTHRWSHFVERQGSGSVRVRVYYDDLARMKIEIPPSLEEQQKIASFLDSVQHEIDQLHALRAVRAREKKGMMQRLLLGEVRV